MCKIYFWLLIYHSVNQIALHCGIQYSTESNAVGYLLLWIICIHNYYSSMIFITYAITQKRSCSHHGDYGARGHVVKQAGVEGFPLQ